MVSKLKMLRIIYQGEKIRNIMTKIDLPSRQSNPHFLCFKRMEPRNQICDGSSTSSVLTHAITRKLIFKGKTVELKDLCLCPALKLRFCDLFTVLGSSANVWTRTVLIRMTDEFLQDRHQTNNRLVPHAIPGYI